MLYSYACDKINATAPPHQFSLLTTVDVMRVDTVDDIVGYTVVDIVGDTVDTFEGMSTGALLMIQLTIIRKF